MSAYLDRSVEGFIMAESYVRGEDCYEMLLRFDTLEDRERFEEMLMGLDDIGGLRGRC